ncbi:unnamed protein product [Parajaminaea phylloscopi]
MSTSMPATDGPAPSDDGTAVDVRANEFAQASHQPQQHSTTQQQQQQQQQAALAGASSTSASTPAQSVQHDILSGWDPEQIASLVSAARATATGSHDASAAQLYEQARHALANLPSNLGQAASTLSEFAAGFKRSDGVAEDGTDGTETDRQDHGVQSAQQQQQDDDVSPHGDGPRTDAKDEAGQPGVQDGEHAQQQQAGQAAHGHDTAATAAAIAAMGTLAGHDGSNGDADMDRDDGLEKTPPLDFADGSDGQDKKAGGRQSKGPETERQRKDNHKEVERKRRAGINLAIQELQGLVPNCDGKGVNKGDIIFKAAQYIRDLKSNEASNIEKWTLEKLLMDQAMNDLGALVTATRQEVERLRARFGKEADDIPRAEDVTWEDQSGGAVASTSAHPATGSGSGQEHGHGHDPNEHHHQHHQHHHSDQHDAEGEEHLNAAFGQQSQQSLAGQGVDGTAVGAGALGDVAAAAAVAARVVAATNGGQQGGDGKSHDSETAHATAADLANTVANSASATMRENVEAVRAAAAAAAAATNHQHQATNLPIEGGLSSGEVQTTSTTFTRASPSPSHPDSEGEALATDTLADATPRASKRQKV